MNRESFKRQWRAARIYIRDEGSRQKAAMWFWQLAPLFSDASAPCSIPHRLASGHVVLRSAPVGPVGRLP